MAPRPKTLDAFLDQGEQRGGLDDETGIINDDEVLKILQAGTEKNYTRAVELWDAFVARTPGADLNDFKSAKDYMQRVAYAIDGRYGDPRACLRTVIQYWKNFTAGWRRTKRLPVLRDDVVSSTSCFIKGPLQNKMSLARQKRARRFGTLLHFIYLGTQLWKYDWHRYDSPRDRLELWDSIMLNVFTSARVGEFIESTVREGSGRGLYYRDMEFVVFRNEDGKPEFAMQVKKDGKGMTATPWMNPEHSMHEGSGKHALLCNVMLTRVAILLAKGAFRDYKMVDQLLSVEPGDEDIVRIEWHPDFVDRPVYERDDGHIWLSRTYCERLRAAGICAGFPSITNHDFRAEALRAIDEEKTFTDSQRRGAAGHGSNDVYDKHYAPRNPGTDGQAAYAGDTPRTLLPKLLRILKMNHNPELAQSLPAREMHELVTSDEYTALASELDALPDDSSSSSATTKKARADLLAGMRKLKLDALRRYRDQQSCNPSRRARSKSDEDVGHYRTPFSRIRHLMPACHRLAELLFVVAPIRSEVGRAALKDLFVVAPIRSKVGRAALKDLIALYLSEFEVEHRPGLEADKCHCRPTSPGKKPSPPAHSRWRHIYCCHKSHLARQSPSSSPEFCFLCPDRAWFTSRDAWAAHCAGHLSDPDTLPFQCDPLIYAKTLAGPGLCFLCLGDASLPPTSRMRQFLTRADWQDHVGGHLAKAKPPACPHPRCSGGSACGDERDFLFHIQDMHCWVPWKDAGMPKAGAKRSRAEAEADDEDGEEAPPRTKRARKTLGGAVRRKAPAGTFSFVDVTSKFVRASPASTPELSDASSSPSSSFGFSSPLPTADVSMALSHGLGGPPCKVDPRAHTVDLSSLYTL